MHRIFLQSRYSVTMTTCLVYSIYLVDKQFVQILIEDDLTVTNAVIVFLFCFVFVRLAVNQTMNQINASIRLTLTRFSIKRIEILCLYIKGYRMLQCSSKVVGTLNKNAVLI